MTTKNRELTLEMLNQISGSGDINQEVAEIKAAILGNPNLRWLWEHCANNPLNEGEDWWIAADCLDYMWGISTGTGYDGNEYDYGTYSHAQILEMIRNYK